MAAADTRDKLTITRRLEWDAGHRLINHEGKCRHLHGHRYVAEITVSAARLDPVGRVVDFSVIKEKVGGWIDENWDHNIILHSNDPLWAMWRTAEGHPESREAAVFAGKSPFAMAANPTAENLAQRLYYTAISLLSDFGIKVEKVRIYETPNCYADFSTEIIRV